MPTLFLLVACPDERVIPLPSLSDASGFDASAISGEDGGGTPPDASEPPDAGAPDAGPPPYDECTAGSGWCTGALLRRACVPTPGGLRWSDEACASGSGCHHGQCTPASCADECGLGEAGAARRCELYDLDTGSTTQPEPLSLHDRARLYHAWLSRHALAAGGVGSPRFSDPPAYTSVAWMDGLGDSAIWTGTYLAAEALRLQVTGAEDARERVVRLVRTLHDWFEVTGDPGMLARFALRSDAPRPFGMPDVDCSIPRVHCGVAYAGAQWDYTGAISRDQYQGVMLGYALAYEALDERDEATRELIRADAVELVQELMRERRIPLTLTWDGVRFARTSVTLRFVVVSTREMKNGGLEASIDPKDLETIDLAGFQEFTPDLADLVKQVPGLSWVPTIPRAASAVMLASFFRVALKVTEGVPAYAERRAAILDYYLHHGGRGGNVDDWLRVARQWVPNTGCGDHYYGNNIMMEPMYNLARLEDDPGRAANIRDTILRDTMWPTFEATKNVFFSFIYAGVQPAADPGVATSAAEQLAQFPPPPRVRVPVDLRGDPRYQPESAECPGQVDHAVAIDVGERVVSDFLWQRQPWSLWDPGNPYETQPGVDYLVAYWLGRKHGFIPEDSAGRCTVWR